MSIIFSAFTALEWFEPGLCRRCIHFVPRVERADRKVEVREKVIYSVISLLIYLVCKNLPLYGMPPSLIRAHSWNPHQWFFPVIAPPAGNVMEWAIMPTFIIRTLLIIFLGLFGVDITNVRENRELAHTVQKLLSMMWGLEWSVKEVLFGISGSNADQLGVGNAILLVFQLWFSGIIVIYLDELLQRGYDFGAGLSLFRPTSICEDIIQKAFYQQQNLYYVTNLLATVLIFLIVIYLQGFRVLLPLTSTKSGLQDSYQINLFYAPNMPIMFVSAIVFLFYAFSECLGSLFSGNFFVDLLGKWKIADREDAWSIPVGGIAYYITAPSSLVDMAANPFHALSYLVFVSSTCAFFSIVWVGISGSSAVDVAFNLRKQEMEISSGNRELYTYIPIACVFGGMCLGALTVLADLTGAFGSGPGILFVVMVISQHFQTFEKDKEIELVSLAPLGI